LTKHSLGRPPRGAPARAGRSNQPTLFRQLKRLPWAQIPAGNRTRDRGHGRRETRTVKAVTVTTPGGIGFPHAQQAVRITRTRIVGGRTSREAAYLTVSLPAGQALPVDLQAWIRRHWHIENRLHHVKDVTFREDQHQARTANGPAVIATLRNTAIGWHRTAGATNIARATRQASPLTRPHHRSDQLVTRQRNDPGLTRPGRVVADASVAGRQLEPELVGDFVAKFRLRAD
ncbi:ISAs1 family transposase, partial [Paractinoplanes toevensis]|uniref:ISAs1 family transposase n=1 Tax=Paractinoplanes toevensis TaxID=571911 RepID=UPI001FE90BF9